MRRGPGVEFKTPDPEVVDSNLEPFFRDRNIPEFTLREYWKDTQEVVAEYDKSKL